LSITASGNAGIGIASPLEKLHVYESSSRSVIQIGGYEFVGTTASYISHRHEWHCFKSVYYFRGTRSD
jgi:hypothetical protein